MIQDRQLIVVSNRQPYRHDYDDDRKQTTVDRPTGGLTAGLDPVMQRGGGTWIAWGDGDKDAEVVDSDDCVSVPPDDPSYELKRVWLSDDQVHDYYYGFSNQVLWPVSHSALTRVRCDAGFWDRYSEVNELFSTAVTDHADDRPIVWFQDYHLALAPKFVRPELPDDALVMHFWHIPWPSWDTFRACPHRRDVLEGLLGNDLLAFHTSRYRSNFL
ncbi:MAG: trehalose-6-phosphate synthase, partial [Halodesulfurarchaeum sp.]